MSHERTHAGASEAFGLPRMLASAATLVRDTAVEWWRGDSLQLGAALAYYTVFSLAPVLIVAIGVAGLVLGESAARETLNRQLESAVGPSVARAIDGVVESASLRPDASAEATAIGLGTVLLGASGAFGQLQRALNRIWDVEPPRGGIRRVLRRRLVSFGTVLLIGLLLLASVLVSAVIAAVDRFAPEFVGPAIALARVGAAFALAAVLFAAIYKILPDCPIAWRDVWVGGAVTALLFEIGKWGIALYLGRAGVVSMYGAAGTLVALLLWVYYSAQILFFGAEFTQVWARRRAAARSA